VAFIERGTLAGEAVIESSLAEVAAGSVEVHSPAVFIIGEVVKLRAQLVSTSVAPPEPVPAME
jgi:uroporphyrin-III C-methyltransferase